MSVHLKRDLDRLHQNILAMCAEVEDLIHQAVDELSEPSRENALALVKRDQSIDRQDVHIEEDCLKLLALHQPVATDLRRVTSVLKICSELERVADLAVHIAERACALTFPPNHPLLARLRIMAQKAIEMIHRSIDSYVELDSELAREICRVDDEIDDMNREIIHEIVAMMHRNPAEIDSGLLLFSISRHIERIADHATNIAEDVVYLVEGTIIRHKFQLEKDAYHPHQQ